jgi:hypothetical protein
MENEQIDLEIRNKLVRAALGNLDNPLTTEQLEKQRENILTSVKQKYGLSRKYRKTKKYRSKAKMSRQTTTTPEGDKKQAARPSAWLSVPPAPTTTPFSTASNVQAADVDPATKFFFAQLDAVQSAQDVINQQRFGLIHTLTPVRGGVQVPHTPIPAFLSAPTFNLTPQRTAGGGFSFDSSPAPPLGVAAASSAGGFRFDSSPAPPSGVAASAGGFCFDSSPAPSKPTQFTFMAPPIPAGGFHFDSSSSSSSSMDEDDMSEL